VVELENISDVKIIFMTQVATTQSRPGLAELLHQAWGYNGSPEQIRAFALALQCADATVHCGAILQQAPSGEVAFLAVHPPLPAPGEQPSWLKQAMEAVAGQPRGQASLLPLRRSDAPLGTGAEYYLALLPLAVARGTPEVKNPAVGTEAHGVTPWAWAAYLLDAIPGAALDRTMVKLEMTGVLLKLLQERCATRQQQADAAHLRQALEVLNSVGGQSRFKAAAMALCNQVATVFQAQRVSLGFLQGRYVRLEALSHSEQFTRKMKLVQDLEAAMEECLDQDLEVLYPPAGIAAEGESGGGSPRRNAVGFEGESGANPGGGYICRAAMELVQQHRTARVCSFPLRREGKVVAVLTVERGPDQPFAATELTALRLACELCTPHLASLHIHDRWLGAQAARSLREGLAALVGPRHTWAKVTAVAACVGLVLCLVLRDTDRVEATFVLQASEKRVIPAPFEGYLLTVRVEPGDKVTSDVTSDRSILATLDTAELRLKLAAHLAERAGYLKQADLAMRDGKTADEQIARAQAEKLQAQIDLLNYQIAQATIRSPVDGQVLSGDLKRQLGAPVQTGQVLFEVAPLTQQWAELAVPEDRIRDIHPGQQGTLAGVAHPGDYLRFEVERINPIAEVVQQHNVFKVRAKLRGNRPWLLPGMEGVAKVEVGRASYAWLWTRQLVHWLRMKLWI